MLLRLYNPFLWRSLKVASPQVRTNAATLFLDVFPLQDPDSTRQEIDTVMQKQFDAMMVRFITVAHTNFFETPGMRLRTLYMHIHVFDFVIV